MKINKHIQDIMDKNGIKLTDVKLFREEDGEGHYIDTEITFEELLKATDINDAVLYWNDINPYGDEITYEIERDLYLIDEEEYKIYKEEMEERENGKQL